MDCFASWSILSLTAKILTRPSLWFRGFCNSLSVSVGFGDVICWIGLLCFLELLVVGVDTFICQMYRQWELWSSTHWSFWTKSKTTSLNPALFLCSMPNFWLNTVQTFICRPLALWRFFNEMVLWKCSGNCLILALDI